MKHRRLARAAAVAALLPLAACTVEGDVFVERADTFRVDLTLSYPLRGTVKGGGEVGTWWVNPCGTTDGQAVLPATRVEAPAGERACHLAGTIDPATFLGGQLGQFVLTASSEDHLFARVPPMNQLTDGDSAIRDLDVTVHFPGEVVAASRAGQAFGASVHLADAELFWTDGLAVTADARPSEPGWLVPGIAGLAWGAALAGVLLWMSRRDGAPEVPAPPSARPTDDVDAAVPRDASVHRADPLANRRPAGTPLPVEDQGVWAPDA